MNIKKVVGYLFFLSLIYSCNNESDIAKGFIIGESENIWKSKIDSLEILGVLSDSDDGYFRCYIADIPVWIKLNDKFKVGNLREITFDLSGDTVYWKEFTPRNNSSEEIYYTPSGEPFLSYRAPFYSRGLGEREYNDGLKIFEELVKIYGKPDSIDEFFIPYKYINTKGDTLSYTGNSRNLKNGILYNVKPNLYAYWYKDNYDIELQLNTSNNLRLGFTNFEYIKPFKNSICENSFLIIRIKNYENHLQMLRDSLKDLYTTNDLIEVELGKVEWVKESRNSIYDYKLNVYIQGFRRELNTDDRGIKAIKFDILILDKFDEEICSMTNITHEFEKDLYTATGSSYWFPLPTYFIKYNISPNNDTYEKARIYSQEHEVKAVADIKAIEFSDGSVLKNK